MDLHLVFNHLVLPPQLPGKQDPDIEAVSRDVLMRMIRACEDVGVLAGPPWSETFQSLRASLNASLALNKGRLEKAVMLKYFSQLQPGYMLILHMAQQNAALLIRRATCKGQQCVIFEAFETSATSEETLAAHQALQWDFPGRSAMLPLAEFVRESFQECLASFLEQASMESIYSLQAHAHKANVCVTEVRDTTDPALITQMLMPLLEAMGDHFQAPLLRKRVRDDVNLRNADLPWRRIPFWLVLRVAAQRQLSLALGNEKGRIGYKFLLCTLLTELLKESAGELGPDLIITLRAKLCRRMAKLEMNRTKMESADAEFCEPLFGRVTPVIKTAIKDATAQVEAAWKSFKQATTRHIPKLPLCASDGALKLSLANSGESLDLLLSLRSVQLGQMSPVSLDLPQPLDKAVRQTQDFTDNIFRLAAMEMRVHRDEQPNLNTQGDCQARCLELARQINQVFAEVGTTYDLDPEQMSAMILALFTLWVRLDKCAVAACPLLRDYLPAFEPELLDVLQLPTMSNMRRLQDIQTYLAKRRSGCLYGTIFSKIGKSCLAVRYVTQSAEMQSLGSRIQTADDQARDAKEAEWRTADRKYDDCTKVIVDSTCSCSVFRGGKQRRGGCTKCRNYGIRGKIKVDVHEAYLPKKNDPARAAVLFELAIPEYLAKYRDATWRILSTLAHPDRTVTSSSSAPKVKLKDCKPLQRYMTAGARGISLASTVKCFEQTHYKFNKGKIPLSRVVLYLGARFELYDQASELWVKDLDKPLTFYHLCGVHVPRSLQATLPPSSAQHPPPDVDGPSSYSIQANQGECPINTSVHEFATYQKLLAGKTRRWLNIIVELGSSNLNFSSDDTTQLLCQLAVQAGPQLSGEVLRAVHVVFKEAGFIDRLAEMIEKRLHAILTNWREHNCMELLVTLSLRLFELSSGTTRDRAEALLKIARDAALGWTASLRKEVGTAVEADVAERAATYAVYAALLCRRTFAIYGEIDRVINKEDITSWTEASVALQENLSVDIDKLPRTLKRMLIRDTKMAYHIKPRLRQAVKVHTAGVGDGIVKSWSDSPGSTATIFSQWTFLSPPDDRWIVATTSVTQERFSFRQTVHYNILEGHLLVNGRPRGKLPLEIRNNAAVKDLFGNQHLLTYPSSVPGMTHRLAGLMHGQEVHFGLRGDEVVIRALTRHQTLQFIHKRIFSSRDSFDLPSELVDNCVHWLNLNTECLEIRRAPALWVRRQRDWIINVRRRRASRGNVNLVDPQSTEFAWIANIFRHFERPERLTVYQPLASEGGLSVELRHLDLSFKVNGRGWLECRQLKAEVDPDQDAGTWYGLQSRIVLRDLVSRERSIILPLGEIKFERHGVHVKTHVNGAHDYGLFKIDDVLGRLLCPPEPRLLYTKALCHATTSFCLPDTLTGRTGTEEAFAILRSAAAQPWTPLGAVIHPIFKTFEALLPCRKYYPPQIKRLQRVTWNKNLTTTIQHDGYEALIHSIMKKSNRLNKFANNGTEDFEFDETTHLRRRGAMHRRLYERPTQDTAHDQVMEDKIYVPRDRRVTDKAVHVHEIVCLILTRCFSLHISTTLRSVLESWQVIGGFQHKDGLPVGGPLISQIEDPIHEQWGDLVNFCRHAASPVPVMFRLGLLAFAPDTNMDAVRCLAAFAVIDDLKNLRPPTCSSFVDFKSRGKPSLQQLEKLIQPCHKAFEPRSRRGQDLRDSAGRTVEEHQKLCEEEGSWLAQHVLKHWEIPEDMLSTSGFEAEVVDVSLALNEIKPERVRRQRNDKLERYVEQMQAVLDLYQSTRDASAPVEWREEIPLFIGKRHERIIPSLSLDLVVKAGPRPEDSVACDLLETRKPVVRDRTSQSSTKEILGVVTELKNILNMFARSTDALRQQYGGDLLQSLTALKNMDQTLPMDPNVSIPAIETVIRAIKQARATMINCLGQISIALAASDRRSEWLQLGSIWPCMTATAVLVLLRSKLCHEFGMGMKEALVLYGVAMTRLQRLERIRHALLRQDRRALGEELRNPGHENWSPLQQPEWLLLEIDSNFLIRAEQVDVAWAIIAPQSGKNSVLQMIMGKGKSSCIVPMVIAILADGKNLFRLIVPKALLMQTAQTVQSRLGGLVDREVCHIPFSRKTSTTSTVLELYAELHHETCGARGLMLTSHEHVLSYKLGGWQHLADDKLEAATNMIRFQDWLNNHCRDVLDECDFTLSIKTQLNYPGGPELPVDGHPFRWQVAQGLLALAAYHVPRLRARFPGRIEVLERPGSFPMIHILDSEVEDALHDCLLDDVCAGRTSFLRLADSTFQGRREVRRILSEQKFDECLFTQAVGAFANPQAAHKMILVVRGLLINRILVLSLNRRWNVNYGLDPSRHPVAVPFDAKGVPSEQSEFGHPDVSILLTCLAFYYTGLSSKQFCQGLQHVLQSNDPAAQYERWTSGCDSLPEALHYWNVVNIDDEGQIEELWRHLRLDCIVINHYMNHFVFPAHARQFDVKLQASAWDIPLFSEEQRGAHTTGFSGTNDNRVMLPLTIQQDDLPSLRQTSAEVLSYLLQPRNRGYQVMADIQGKRLTEEGLLKQLHKQNIRLLIDAGAYVLEMDNKTLAKTWLGLDHTAKAAVYFGNDNRAWVHFRGDTKNDVPLLATPFMDNLSECVVYLDEAHTRGIDLKFPEGVCGALTLALKQTKDYTVQAAMRLRQLGTTQSVAFFAPPEVNHSIKDFCGPSPSEKLNSSHVVSWLLEQTCRTHEDLHRLYVTQGIDFCRRTDVAWRYRSFMTDTAHRSRLLEVLRQPERQTLEQLYGPASAGSVLEEPMSAPELQAFVNQLTGSSSRRDMVQIGALEEVEQEREVQVQAEQVCQVQKPVRHEALLFPGLHPTILQFVRTGELGTGRDRPGFEHAFACVARTSIGRRLGVRETASRLFVSDEFGKTVKFGKAKTTDNFFRPAEWILWSPSTQTALVVIPEEVELIIPMLRLAAGKSPVHLIAYAAPVTKAMLPFNSFQYYNLPPLPTKHIFPQWFRIEMGVLAGWLYVDSAEWDFLAGYLRPQLGQGLVKLADDPAAFVLEWLALRRKTQDILHTPLGYICTGRMLGESRLSRDEA